MFMLSAQLQDPVSCYKRAAPADVGRTGRRIILEWKFLATKLTQPSCMARCFQPLQHCQLRGRIQMAQSMDSNSIYLSTHL